jgi:hypothetical protein
VICFGLPGQPARLGYVPACHCRAEFKLREGVNLILLGWVSTSVLIGDHTLLTEKEVSRSWRTLFKGGVYDEAALNKAEELLEELRAESPLRHRLQSEIDELRKLQVSR